MMYTLKLISSRYDHKSFAAMSQLAIRVNNYQVGRTLGQGAYGKVKRKYYFIDSNSTLLVAINETIDTPVAFKVLNKNKVRKLGMQERVKREIKCMKKLQHPHIVSLYQVIDTPSDIFLVLELASNGTLFDRIAKSGRVSTKQNPNLHSLHLQISENDSKRIFRQLVAGLAHCHSKGIAHRDLKLENLLLDDHSNIKIADFGLCARMKDGVSLQTSCGSPDYAAPEIIEHQPYDGTKVDAWSAGVILYIMLYGHLPFEGLSQSKMFEKVIAGSFKFLDEVVTIPTSAKDLISRLLDPNPVTRMSPTAA